MPLFLFIFVPSTWGLLTSSAPTFGSLRPPCSIWLTSHLLNLFATSLPLGGTFPPIPVWFRRFLSVVLRTFVLISFLVVCSAAVKNWVWVRALPLAIWTTLASFLLLPNLSLSVKADSQVPVLQGCWEGQWDSAGKLLSSASGTGEALSKRLAACHLKPILIFGGFPQVESWKDCIHLQSWKAGCSFPLPLRCGAWAPLIRCPSLRVYVLCPCTTGGGGGDVSCWTWQQQEQPIFYSSRGNRTSHNVLTRSSLWRDFGRGPAVWPLLVSAHFWHLVLQASQKFCEQSPPPAPPTPTPN